MPPVVEFVLVVHPESEIVLVIIDLVWFRVVCRILQWLYFGEFEPVIPAFLGKKLSDFVDIIIVYWVSGVGIGGVSHLVECLELLPSGFLLDLSNMYSLNVDFIFIPDVELTTV